MRQRLWVVLACVAGMAHAACTDPPQAGVDWNGCDKHGARLAGPSCKALICAWPTCAAPR